MNYALDTPAKERPAERCESVIDGVIQVLTCLFVCCAASCFAAVHFLRAHIAHSDSNVSTEPPKLVNLVHDFQ